MRRAWVSVGLLVGLAGCGSGELELWRSGQRMRARVAVAADGFTIRVDWHDRELGLHCGSHNFANGPAVEGVHCGAVRASDEPFFTDQQCTQPAVALPARDTNQGYAFHGGGLFRIATEPLPTFFSGAPPFCMPTDVPLDVSVYPVLEELPFDTLVSWHVSRELGSDVDAYSTDDGALDIVFINPSTREVEEAPTRLRLITQSNGRVRAAVGIYDSERGHDCDLATTSGGVLRCLPPSLPIVLFREYYRDPECRGEQVLALSEPGLLHVRDPSGVVTAVEEYQTLDAGLYSGTPSMCFASEPQYVTTSTIPLEMFEPLTLEIE